MDLAFSNAGSEPIKQSHSYSLGGDAIRRSYLGAQNGACVASAGDDHGFDRLRQQIGATWHINRSCEDFAAGE